MSLKNAEVFALVGVTLRYRLRRNEQGGLFALTAATVSERC